MDMPFAYLMSCSEEAAGDFAASTLNRLAELKKARREIDDGIAELEGTAQVMEWLRAHKIERAKLLRLTNPNEIAPQASFRFVRGRLTA